MGRSVRKYTKEFREEAVRLAFKSGSVKTTAEELGIPAGTLSTWIFVLKKKGDLTNTDASGAKDMAALIEENRRLHKELGIARS